MSARADCKCGRPHTGGAVLKYRLNEVELCYVAALVEGLRLIDEKAREMHVDAEIDFNALEHFIRRKGDYLLQLHGIEPPPTVYVPSQDRKGHHGRNELSELTVEAMIKEYRRTKSLAKAGAKFGRTRQAMWEILRKRIELNKRPERASVLWRGMKFTPEKDGYLRRTDVRGSSEIFLHRLVWIEANGPIPAGYSVAFRDGDKQNCALDNLQCLPRTDVLARYQALGENGYTKLRKLEAAGIDCTKARESMERATSRGPRHSAVMRSTWARCTPEQRAARIAKATRSRWPARNITPMRGYVRDQENPLLALTA